MLTCAAALVLALAATELAGAAPLITNGGFESGFTSWTLVDQLGSDGTFFQQSETSSPVNLDPVPAPPGGNYAAMTDAQGPGSHLLYQDFVVPASLGSAVLTFDLFIGNRVGDFFTPSPASLDFSTPALNQQARVDILPAGTDPFSVSLSDVLLPLFQTNPGDPLISGYTPHNADVTALLNAHLGETLRLRFAETDNVFIFQLGVDNVSLDTVSAIPEPTATLLLGSGLVGLAGLRRKLEKWNWIPLGQAFFMGRGGSRGLGHGRGKALCIKESAGEVRNKPAFFMPISIHNPHLQKWGHHHSL
jgi:hypothetical protein